jgi:acetyltransferase
MTSKPLPSPASLTDPAHDILRAERQPLDAIFRPASVAVIGASEREASVGRTVLANLANGSFSGKVFAVNPNRREVLGVASYPSVTALPQRVDLAVIVTPAATVPDVMRDCVAAHAGGAIIISAGFKEVGAAGAALEQQIAGIVRPAGLRVIGPNCLGVMSPHAGLNATFAAEMPLAGNVAFLSQSGALCTAILDRSRGENIGFSAFVSTGSMLDVTWGDLLYYFGDDPATRCILIYMESVGNAGAFLSAAREVTLKKPVIVIKPGRTAAAAKAAASHTGSLTGSDDVLDAAFRRCGVLRVDTISELFAMADVLGKQPLPKGPRLAILTNAGGPAVLATDALILGGSELAQLTPETLAHLDSFLPRHWSHGNPVDILGDSGPDRYHRAAQAIVHDAGVDGLLAILAPQGMTAPEASAQAIAPLSDGRKPVLASFMGGPAMRGAEAVFNQANIPNFPYPDSAVKCFNFMWQYSFRLGALYETPRLPDAVESAPDRLAAAGLIQRLLDCGRTIMTEAESKRLLAAYGIPTVPTEVAASEEEAVHIASRLGFPVVLKLHSETITHKSDVGGVALDLTGEAEVRAAFARIREAVASRAGADHFLGVAVQPMLRVRGYELILGSSLDPQFGPVLLFGSGGKLVEVFQDRALGLPPLNSTLARRLMERTRIFTALKGVRGEKPVDLSALESLLVRFSYLVAEQPWIRELDINPLLASAGSLIALDARVVLHPAGTAEASLSWPAIRPYPARYESRFTARDGTEITFRPVRPEDEPRLVEFHRRLSQRSVYLRWYQPLALEERIAHERLARICHIDYDREMALIAEREGEILAIGRVSKRHQGGEGRVTLLIRDEYQRRGLGRALLERLLAFARDERLKRITAEMLPENVEMQGLARSVGFKLSPAPAGSLITAVLDLA